jgi:hypothetical protein
MLGTLRSTAKRTLVLTGILIAAVSISAASGLMVQGAKAEGSMLSVEVSNSSSSAVSGSVSAIVLVNGCEVFLSAPVELGPGNSSVVSLDAFGRIDGIISLGSTADNPVPF